MVGVKNRKCAQQGCSKVPSYGNAGTKKREFCSGHAKEGMVNLNSKKCVHPGCSKVPSFGVAGTKDRDFCAGHTKQMVALVHSE